MAKARKKSAKKQSAKKSKAKTRKVAARKSKARKSAGRTKAAVKAPPTRKVRKPKNLAEQVTEAFQSVVDTIKDTTQLRRNMPARQSEE